ncbi:MAG: hypothetical protein EBT20_10230 [Alphaproteobacteria bacterium]|nr:hypothetical protein [Alphaproteobacteria bacterium]
MALIVLVCVGVSLSNADFGLEIDGDAAVFALTDGTFGANLAGIASIRSDEVIVEYASVTGAVSAGETLAVGNTGYQFQRDIVANSAAFVVVGMELDIADFVTLSGDVGFQGRGEEIIAVGDNLSASLGNDLIGASLTDAKLGFISRDSGTAFELKEGEFNLSLAGLAGVQADSMFIQYASDGFDVLAGETLNIGNLSYAFDSGVEAGSASFEAQGFKANVANFVELSGDIGVSSASDGIVVVGNNVGARLGVDEYYVQVSNSDFGLISNDDGTTFELTNGALSSSLGALGSFSLGTAVVVYSDEGMSVAQDTEIAVGSTSYLFSNDISEDQVIGFGIKGFALDVADFVRLGGDIAFAKQGDGMVAVGNNVSASLGTAEFGVALTEASFGLQIDNGVTFALSEGAFDLNVGPIANVTTDRVYVAFASDEGGVTAGTAVGVADISYTFVDEIGAGDIAFAVEGLQADVLGFVELSGDLGFASKDDDVIAVGSDVSAKLGAGEYYVALSNANFGLVSNAQGLIFELADGAFDLSLGPIANPTAEAVFIRYSSRNTDFVATELNVGPVSYVFDSDVRAGEIAFAVQGFQADLSDFLSINGSLGFAKRGDGTIEAIGQDIGVSVGTDDVGLKVSGATFGLLSSSEQFALEVTGGALELNLAAFAEFSFDDVKVQYTDAQTTIQAGTTITIGGLTHEFSGIAADTIGVQVIGISANLADFVTLEGDLGFVKSGNNVVAIGNEVSAFMGVDEAYVRVSKANFGARFSQDGFIFETTGGDLDAKIEGMTGISAQDVGVFYSEGIAQQAGTVLAAGALTYTFQRNYVRSGTKGFEASELEADFFGILKASGNMSFVLNGLQLQAEGSDFNISFELGDAVRVAIVDTDFAFGYFDEGFRIFIDGSAELDLFDFVAVQFQVSIDQTFETRKLTDGTEVAVATFTFAKSDIDFNVGSDTVGFGIEDADLGFALNLAVDGSMRYWLAAKASSESVYFRGADILEVSADELDVLINTSSSDAAIDWSDDPLTLAEGFGVILPGVEINSGDLSDITLDMNQEIIAVRGFLNLNLLTVFRLSGEFSFQQVRKNIMLTTGETVDTRAMSFAAAGVDGVLGIEVGGNLFGFRATDVDFGFALYNEVTGTRQWGAMQASAQSLALSGIPGLQLSANDVGISYLKGAVDNSLINVDFQPIDFAGLDVAFDIQMGDLGIDLSAFDVSLTSIASNLGLDIGAIDLADFLFALPDYNIPGLNIDLPSIPRVEWPSLSMPDPNIDWRSLSLSEFIRYIPSLGLPDINITYAVPDLPDVISLFNISSTFNMDLFGLFQAEVPLDLKLKLTGMVTNEGDTVEVAYLSFAVLDNDIFLGSGSRENGTGLAIDNINLGGVVLLSPTTSEVFFAGKAESDFAGLVGVSGIELQVDDIEFSFNVGTNENRVIDFSQKPLTIEEGLGIGGSQLIDGDGNTMTFDMDGSNGRTVRLALNNALFNISDVVYVSGSYILQVGTVDGVVLDGLDLATKIQGYDDKFEYIAFGAVGANIWVGANGPYFRGVSEPDDAIGFYASGIDFLLTMFNGPQFGFIGLDLDMDGLGLIGFGDIFTAQFDNVRLNVNMHVKKPTTVISTPWIDYQESFGEEGFKVSFFDKSLAIAHTERKVIDLRVGWANIVIADFFRLEGSLAFAFGQKVTMIKIDPGLVQQVFGVDNLELFYDVEMITMGAADLTGFIGIADSIDDPNRVGLEVRDVNLGMAFFSPSGFFGFDFLEMMNAGYIDYNTYLGFKGFLPNFISMKGSVGYAGLVGMGDSWFGSIFSLSCGHRLSAK